MKKLQITSSNLKISNRLGLHARAAAKIVKMAEAFKSDIALIKGENSADVRSLLSLLSLGCSYDSTVFLKAEGEDAAEAILALQEIIEQGFGET